MRHQSLWNCGIVSALFLASGTVHAEWRDWWWTQEQQAQQALDAGRAAQAAPLFSDPERRAYAEIKAGEYQPAAKRLASMDSPEAQYNRGNALARAGDLRGALAAYEAALARSAKGSVTERDARHNRDLLARQLQKQQQQEQQRQEQGQEQQEQQSGEQQKSDGSAQNAEPSASKDQPSGQDATGEASSAAQNPSADEQDPERDKEDAKRDADRAKEEDSQAARAEESRSRDADGSNTKERQAAQNSNPDSPPTSERALAVEQWLRQIPDDPGGLLRRKFLLEHRRKQREARP